MPRKLRFTREGRVFIVVTLGVGAAAVNTGNNLLYLVLGLLLSLIVLSGIMSEGVLRGLKVRRRLPRRAFAGSPCLVELIVDNVKARVPSYSLELQDVASEAVDARCFYLKLGPGETQTAAYQRTPEARGPILFSAIEVRTRYPFGLFEKSRRFDLEETLLVYPGLLPAASFDLDDERLGPDVPSRRRGVGTDVAGLRELRDGDEARAIHWRRSASLGRTMVRERHRDSARQLSLFVDDQAPEDADVAWRAQFEETLRRTATIAGRAVEEGAAVDVATRHDRSPLVAPGRPPDPVWRFLALIDPESSPDSSKDTA